MTAIVLAPNSSSAKLCKFQFSQLMP